MTVSNSRRSMYSTESETLPCTSLSVEVNGRRTRTPRRIRFTPASSKCGEGEDPAPRAIATNSTEGGDPKPPLQPRRSKKVKYWRLMTPSPKRGHLPLRVNRRRVMTLKRHS